MTHLREFLHRQIEVFLNHEFGPGMQNMTPTGIRRISWTPEHTGRLVGHLAGNWEMVEEALRVRQEEAATRTHDHEIPHKAGCAYCPTKFDCTCDSPGARHMCPQCDDAAEESKLSGGTFIASEVTQDRTEANPDA